MALRANGVGAIAVATVAVLVARGMLIIMRFPKVSIS